MTHEQLQAFVTAANDALPASMELRIEVVDRMRQVVHFRVDRQDGSSFITFTYEALAAMMDDPTSAARDVQKMFTE